MNEITLPNGKKVHLSIVSARRFNIETDHPETIVIRDDKGNFISLNFSDFYSMKKGEEFLIKDSEGNLIPFVLRDVAKINPNSYDGIDQKLTKTCIFILPLLLTDYSYFDYNYSLYNGYISEDCKYIYLKYRFINSEKFLQLEDKLRGHSQFVRAYDPDKNFVVYVFKLQDRYKDYISKILEGKYSQISDYYKKIILRFHKASTRSTIGFILYKDSLYRKKLEKELGTEIPDDIDLMSKGLLEEELWIYQDISQKIGITS